ncbi:O-antigen ligase family protein [Neptuniibacter sp.]|uniref:PglL family O-oligosaccharyltransferase n=1 Tax=Neptuniibacter sp. TaxID=1962643 RepID=UPI00262604B4|nr:O-antigen ligase family protein [Neptuniibacter sp.]
MATLLILVFYLISRPTLSSLSPVIKIALFTAAFLASYTISVSGSRIGLLGAILGLLMMLLGRWRQLVSPHARTTFIIALFCMLAGTLVNTSGLEKATDKADRAIGGMEKDVRWKVYDLSWQLYKEAPLFGHGLGSFQKVFQDKRAEYQKIEGNSLGTNPRFTHPHNEIIFWMVEGGIFAILGIMCAAIVTFMQLAKAGWQRGIAYAALLIPIVLHTQVELPFYISNTHWFMLLFLLFLTHQFGKKEVSTEKLSIAAHKSIPVFFIVLFTLSSWILAQSQVANAGIISYLKRNQSQPIFIVEGLKSLYFRGYSEYLYYRRNMYIELQQGKTEATDIYIEWANEALKTMPSTSIYQDLAIAYHKKKDFELRDAVLQEAQMMYNRDKSLPVLQEKLLKQEEEQRQNLSNPSLKQGADVSQALPQANQQ